MLAYHISQSNSFAIRTEPSSSNEWTMSMQNMYTLENSIMTMTGITYDGYESLLQFTASIDSASIGAEYRLALYNSGSTDPIWHGSVQCYTSQSIDKSVYENQIPPVISHASENRYIILQ
jgi:hypothetical protein